MEWIKKGALAALLLTYVILSNAKTLPEWQIIPEKSELTFKALQTIDGVEKPIIGAFKQFNGEISGDPANYKDSAIHLVIDISSLASADSDVVDGLSTPDWFDPGLFPKADYKAIKFNKLGEKTYQADGFLTIRDKSAPVTIIFTAKELSENTAFIDGETLIKRSTFGIGVQDVDYNSTIKDEVSIYFKVTVIRKKRDA